MPPALEDGWAVASPSEVGLDAAQLAGLGTLLRRWPKHNVHAVVVVRRGKLVFERYFPGIERHWMDWGGQVQFSPTQKHDIRSISKSVVSLLVGMAVSENRFPPLEAPVVDYFSEYADLSTAKKRRITFRHLLTMSHGLRWDESRSWKSQANNERQLLEAKDPYRYVLERPMALPPGVSFNYSGGATSLLAAALVKAVGQGIDVYASEKLFKPLGITDFEWLNFSGCADVAAFAGLRLRPRDLAKFGQLVADAGCWNSRQLLPARWISESTTPHVNAEGSGALYYGYHWWLGRSLLNGHDLSWIAGFGSGGQRLFVVPRLDLVVVINAFNYRHHVPMAILNGFVLPAVTDFPSLSSAGD
ncbi:serine hydrolase [Bradyrhizobium sp. OAE829]|uniref:serine hydrolase domain-containing protein n=1 Tax=Bradyrhizobium sp. OAE829 TaxID=2663807 RepID=UPI0033928ED5